jgi:hypothetical protein
MAKAKSPRSTNSSNKQVITMPDSSSVFPIKKNGSTLASMPSSSSANTSASDLVTKIRERAYELYQQRGCTHGHEHEDWLQAEQEILARYKHQQSA